MGGDGYIKGVISVPMQASSVCTFVFRRKKPKLNAIGQCDLLLCLVMSLCVCECVCPVRAITFHSLDLETSRLTYRYRYIFRISRSSL